MKVNTAIVLVFFSIFGSFAQELAEVKHVMLASKALQQNREILIYTPQSYKENYLTQYEVVYVFDAHTREFFDLTHSMISFLSRADKQYIVVGITSPYNEALDYSRRNDFLPEMQTDEARQAYGKYCGNADKFFQFVTQEVFSYMQENYRVLSRRSAIGHSLGASFLVYSFLKNPDTFDNYVLMSPNLAYDANRLIRELKQFDFSTIKPYKYFYLSFANEAVSFPEWKPAIDESFVLFESLQGKENFYVKSAKFPESNHFSSALPALTAALSTYFTQVYDRQQAQLSDTFVEVEVVVEVSNPKAELYITGNQKAVGNWNPAAVKMNRLSDKERSVKLKVQSPFIFKITQGSWESEATLEGVSGNVCLLPSNEKRYRFKAIAFAND
ncbi:alpha/beta hydrolase-fold protein [Flavobacterium sp.]|uniref:alpha/beta hydrolase-fold protein n=1 Tax=Flavobacterium sp. TaxID=239 RepID=UPI00261107F3|nr:alpha/beta hydrolase-fold protein [Flavobacterium sp.]